MPGTLFLFLTASLAMAALWNRFFEPVPWRLVGLFVLICATYQAEMLFTSSSNRHHAVALVSFLSGVGRDGRGVHFPKDGGTLSGLVTGRGGT